MVYEDGARYVVLAGLLSLKYNQTSLKAVELPKFTAYQSWLLADPPAPQNGSLIGKPSIAPTVDVPDPVKDAVAVLPAARLVLVAVMSTPALAIMSTSRALPVWSTWVGDCTPETAVLNVTVPD